MKIKKLVLTAIMTAICVVLNELVTIDIPPTATPMIRLSIGIIPVFIMAYYCGIFYAVVGATLADILGFFIFSVAKGYAFHPGYTLNAFLSGLIIGFFILIRKFMNTKKGLALLIATDALFVLITSSLFTFMYFHNDLLIGDKPIGALITILSFSIIINIGIVIYAIFSRENEDSNAIIMSFIVYQYIVSMSLTPLWVSMMTGVNYFYYWIMRMVTVPIQIMIYVLLSKLIVYPLNKIYKNRFEKTKES